jgi:son of sevenless-like protein
MDIDSIEMARQLTLLESTLYKQIRAIDCLNRSKEQKGKSSSADHISTIIDHTNKASNFWLEAIKVLIFDSRSQCGSISRS